MKPMTVLARITAEPISLDLVARELARSGHGAQIVFSAVVRDRNRGRTVIGVSYDADVPLAEKTFREIGEEARARWGADLALAILHRTGRLAVGDACLVIAASSPHRDAAYEASRYVLEQFKTRSPVWKQEHYADGESEWLRGQPLRAGAAA